MQDNGAETRLPVDSTVPPKVQHGSSCLVSGHKWITSSCPSRAKSRHGVSIWLCEKPSSIAGTRPGPRTRAFPSPWRLQVVLVLREVRTGRDGDSSLDLRM